MKCDLIKFQRLLTALEESMKKMTAKQYTAHHKKFHATRNPMNNTRPAKDHPDGLQLHAGTFRGEQLWHSDDGGKTTSYLIWLSVCS